ncbi:Macrophage mannose receptor 1-like isoform X1 [Aphelenchoides bicaudatus]|nr:Macrophage mannose receptor 1-like isoform X1 [Aphelenchoides bicaudatus]
MRWRATVVALFFLSHTLFVWADECPEGSMPGFPDDFTADCYLYERFPTQFVTAERLCRQRGGNLVSIFDTFVNTFVAQGGVEAFSIMERKSFWIGGHNLHDDDTWQWVDDKPWKYTKWDDGQPANSSNHCVAMHLDEGVWKVEDCFVRKPYVCAINFGDHHNVTTPKTTAIPSTPQFETTVKTSLEASTITVPQESTRLPSSTVTPIVTVPQESTVFTTTTLKTTVPVETTLQETTPIDTTKLPSTTLGVETTVPVETTPIDTTKLPSTSIPIDTTVFTTSIPIDTTVLTTEPPQQTTKLPSTSIPIDTTKLPSTSIPIDTTTLGVETTVLTTEPPQQSTSTPIDTTTLIVETTPQETTKLPSTSIPIDTTTLAIEMTVLTTEPPQQTTVLVETTTLIVETTPQETTSIPIDTTTLETTTIPIDTTTSQPTTKKATTPQQTTKLPSTAQPTTKLPSTVQPSTKKETTSAPIDTTTIDPTFPCPANWLFDDDLCYYPIKSTGWVNDQATCQSLGSNLVSIHSKVQNGVITLISNKGKTKNANKQDISIGLREVKVNGKRQWSWIDNTKLNFIRWDTGYDTTPTGALKCGTYHLLTGKKSTTNGVWRYVECDSIQSQAICMTPADYKDYSTEERDLSKHSSKERGLIKRSISRPDRLNVKTHLPENFSL